MRFPPYIYKYNNRVIHRKKGWRLLTIEEKEAIMGFPMGFTIHSAPKSVRKSQPNLADDIRMTLIGNSWHVGVVSSLLVDLFYELGLCSLLSVEEIVRRITPGI